MAAKRCCFGPRGPQPVDRALLLDESRDSISLREMNAPCARAVLSPFLALDILVHMK